MRFGVVVSLTAGPFPFGCGGSWFMSYLLFDFLLPLIGPAAAEYWATLLVVGPL